MKGVVFLLTDQVWLSISLNSQHLSILLWIMTKTLHFLELYCLYIDSDYCTQYCTNVQKEVEEGWWWGEAFLAWWYGGWLVDRARSPRHCQASQSLASLARHILRTTSLLRCLNTVITLVVAVVVEIFCCHQNQEKEKPNGPSNLLEEECYHNLSMVSNPIIYPKDSV